MHTKYWLEDPGKTGEDWRIILDWILEKYGGKLWLESFGSGRGSVAGSSEHSNELSESIKCGEFLD